MDTPLFRRRESAVRTRHDKVRRNIRKWARCESPGNRSITKRKVAGRYQIIQSEERSASAQLSESSRSHRDAKSRELLAGPCRTERLPGGA